MTNNSGVTTRRAVLAGVAGALATGGVGGAQETTEGGETTTAGGETTTEGGQTTTPRGETATFTVRILNTSEPDALTPEGGEPQPVVLSPGVYAVHSAPGPLFTPEEPDRGEGLEALAEDGNPSELAASLEDTQGVLSSGVFDTSVAGGETGPIGPGDSYGFQVEAAPGDRLSLATMFVPSNDLFFAPPPGGIRLFRQGDAISGSVTDRIALWDAGTEQNEEPGAGPNQAPRQSGPNTGPDENAPVRRIEGADTEYEYPNVSDTIEVLVVPETAVGDGGGVDETTTGTDETTAVETATQ